MKQTVEETAKEYSLQWAWNSQPDMWQSEKDFKAGAEWQSKQSPWISVENRFPEVGELVLCRMVSNGAIVSGFIEPVEGCQPIVSTLPNFEFEDYSDYVCDMWMPIPSFDQILEANKDVLQRMKEKGD